MRHNRIWSAPIFGLAILALSLALATEASAGRGVKVPHTFGVIATNPVGGLIADSDGNLYGTTSSGVHGGTVFELVRGSGGTWTYKVLHIFRLGDGSDPQGALVFDKSGNLYGTTQMGGAHGSGIVFELTPASNAWTEIVLHDFDPNSGDGANPVGGLIFDDAGDLYGTTTIGGANNAGAVFELTQTLGTWTETVLYSFTGGDDGGGPLGPVTLDGAGNLYGTTGGAGAFGDGVVFELTASSLGWTESVVYAFQGADGLQPAGALVFDSLGNMYGTTESGGNEEQSGGGVAFELSPVAGGGWAERVLHRFRIHRGDGFGPNSALTFDANGSLYGTTFVGGKYGYGTVFRLTFNSNGNWLESGMYSFTGGRDGANPVGGVILDQTGNLYGATFYGGSGFDTAGDGVIFEVAH